VAQRNISELYAEGQAHFQAGRLREALHCLGKVKEARGDYKDAARLVASIERVFKAERIDALKSEAEDLAARGDFAAAVEALESALAMGAAGDEVRARLSRLREEQELASLYDGGLRHYGEGRWPDALELFARIEARAGDYRDVKDLAANARRKLREEEERRLRARIDGLRREAERAAASEDWDAAAESLLAVLELDPADEAAAAGLAEAGRQKRLKTMYDRACEQYERGQWREALERLRRVSEIFGDYKDTSARIAVARRELEKVRGEERRRELLKRLFADVEEALGRKDWAKADELLGGAPEGADGGKLTAYRALVERGRRQEELERLNGERGQMEDAGLTEQPPVTQMPTARTPAAGTAEVEPASDVHAERPTTPAAEPDVALAKIKKARVPIIFLIAAVAATCLTLILLRRGAPTPPPDNKNATSPSPPPAPEVVKGPPSLTVESLGELSAGHDLWEVAFSPDGRTLAAVGDSGEVSLWGVGELKSLTPLKAGAAPSRSLAISPDAGTVTSGDDAGNIRLWQLGGGEQAFKTLRGHDAWVFGLAFSADGQTLTSVGGDRTVRRWRVGNGEELESIKLPPRQLVMALAPGQRAVALVADFKAAEGMVSVWSLDERRTLRKMAARAEVTCGAFSPDGGVLAAGNAKGEVRLWHVNDASPLFPPAAAKGTPLSVAFSPDGRVVAVGWRDGFIRLWSAGDGSLLKEWKGHEDAVKNLAFSGDGKTLASGGGSKLALWRVTVN
jgi:WD40 repeat protein/outer membrane protein assembly factor BamD (BamD/ComL family)